MTDTTKWVLGFVITLTVTGFGFLYSWGDEEHEQVKETLEQAQESGRAAKLYEQVDLYDLMSRPQAEQKVIIEHRVRGLNRELGIETVEK